MNYTPAVGTHVGFTVDGNRTMGKVTAIQESDGKEGSQTVLTLTTSYGTHLRTPEQVTALIALSIYENGKRVVATTFYPEETRKAAAYRMRWLKYGNPKGYFISQTMPDGVVREYGNFGSAPLTERAAEFGRRHGTNAGNAVFDGNTSRRTYMATLKGIEDGDPQVMDAYNPPNLSGEFGDDFSEADLLEALGLADLVIPASEVDAHEELVSECCQAYDDAASEAFWAEIERVCRYQLS